MMAGLGEEQEVVHQVRTSPGARGRQVDAGRMASKGWAAQKIL